MELPVRTIAALFFVMLVMLSFAFLLSSQSGESLSRTEANRIFYDTCSEYRKSKCDWTLTYNEKYNEYMKACRVLFEQEAGRYSCLYRFCCEETKNVLCAGLCHACEANKAGGLDTGLCCARYRAECGGAVCGACD